ncbi:unnamed protein product [Urochloa humidicola]
MRLLSFVPCGCRAGPIDDAPPADHAAGDAAAAARRRRRRRRAAAAAAGHQWRPSLGDIYEECSTDAAAKHAAGSPGCSPGPTAMNTGTLRAPRPCQRSRRRRTCSDHGGIGVCIDDQSAAATTTTYHQKYCLKHVFRLLSTYCRTKDLYASMHEIK